MTRPSLVSAAPARCRMGGWLWSLAVARRLASSVLLGLALSACGGGGAGGGADGGGETPGGGDGEPVAIEPVDLAPGQTEVLVSWEPSEGSVTGYMILLSRNGRYFQLETVVDEPRAQIHGQPGDVVRVLVAAIGADNLTSATSPPSVPIRFHADPNAPTDGGGSPDLPPVGGGPDPDPSPDPTPDPTPDPSPDPTPEPEPGNGGETSPPGSGEPTTPIDDPAPPADPDTSESPDAPVDTTVLTAILRTRLLTAGLQATLAGPSADTQAWIAPWLSGELPTDLVPIATTRDAAKAERDVVWQDASGQLFVSDGAALSAGEALASTLVPGIALLASERFVALADLDGDGSRDWIVADTDSGMASFRSEAQGPEAEPQTARAVHQADTTRLIGHGDFDGDGRIELVWQADDGSLAMARPDGSGPILAAGSSLPVGYVVVAVADLSGDGREDLIARSEEGLVAVGSSNALEEGLALVWSEGLEEGPVGSELVGTIDLDGDGRAELLWLSDGSVEIRGLGETAPRAF